MQCALDSSSGGGLYTNAACTIMSGASSIRRLSEFNCLREVLMFDCGSTVLTGSYGTCL